MKNEAKFNIVMNRMHNESEESKEIMMTKTSKLDNHYDKLILTSRSLKIKNKNERN